MQLSQNTDYEILEGMSAWVASERRANTHVIHYLREIEERRLYLQFASTLFEFCTEVHGYSRSEAQVRIDAMRLTKAIPEVIEDIDAGRLSLTVAAQAQSAFRRENVRRRKMGKPQLNEDEQKTVLEDLMSISTRQADRKLATHFPNQPPPEKVIPLSDNLTRIEFNAETDEMKNYHRLQTVYHHQTGGQWGKLFAILANNDIERLDALPRRAPGIEQGQTRYIRKATKQYVWANWERGCDHIYENGVRCGSRQNLQIDHIIEYGQGGSNEPENLRLLCGQHNRFRNAVNL